MQREGGKHHSFLLPASREPTELREAQTTGGESRRMESHLPGQWQSRSAAARARAAPLSVAAAPARSARRVPAPARGELPPPPRQPGSRLPLGLGLGPGPPPPAPPPRLRPPARPRPRPAGPPPAAAAAAASLGARPWAAKGVRGVRGRQPPARAPLLPPQLRGRARASHTGLPRPSPGGSLTWAASCDESPSWGSPTFLLSGSPVTLQAALTPAQAGNPLRLCPGGGR